jgi:hypothetical protein
MCWTKSRARPIGLNPKRPSSSETTTSATSAPTVRKTTVVVVSGVVYAAFCANGRFHQGTRRPRRALRSNSIAGPGSTSQSPQRRQKRRPTGLPVAQCGQRTMPASGSVAIGAVVPGANTGCGGGCTGGAVRACAAAPPGDTGSGKGSGGRGRVGSVCGTVGVAGAAPAAAGVSAAGCPSQSRNPSQDAQNRAPAGLVAPQLPQTRPAMTPPFTRRVRAGYRRR